MQDSTLPSTGSLFLASLGWIAAVLAFGGFLFIGKPYYYGVGYEQGKQDQFAYDVQKVQEHLGATGLPEGITQIHVLGRVISVAPNSLVLQNSLVSQTNPLLQEPRKQTVFIDADTKLFRRKPYTNEEYGQRVREAERQGVNVVTIPFYAEEPIRFEDIQPTDEIDVLTRTLQDEKADSFTAAEIAVMVYEPQV